MMYVVRWGHSCAKAQSDACRSSARSSGQGDAPTVQPAYDITFNEYMMHLSTTHLWNGAKDQDSHMPLQASVRP